jgi:hypothetical protein
LISQLQFKREEKLEGSGQGGGMRWMSSMTGGGGTYIKCKEKNCMLLIRIYGERVLVKDSLVNYQWKLEAKLELVGTIVLRQRP